MEIENLEKMIFGPRCVEFNLMKLKNEFFFTSFFESILENILSQFGIFFIVKEIFDFFFDFFFWNFEEKYSKQLIIWLHHSEDIVIIIYRHIPISWWRHQLHQLRVHFCADPL